MSSNDPVAAAIATKGVEDEPSSLHSSQLHHSTDLDEGVNRLASSSSLKRNGRTDNHDEVEDDDEDGPVVFDANSVQLASAASPQGSPQSVRSASTARASFESVGFGYRDHLLPLSLSGDDDYDDGGSSYGSGPSSGAMGYGMPEGNVGARSRRSSGGRVRREERRMTLVDGIALTVGVQIGSGIFSSPGVVTLNTGSVGSSLIVWLLSGVLAWTGASSFAELGAAIPLNGGAQAYLNYAFGPLSAYLFAWSAIVCLKPGSGAIIAIIFGEYLARVLYHSTSGDTADPHEKGLEGIPDWSIKLIAVVVVIIVAVMNALSAKLGTRTQVATTIVKLAALIAVPILAIIQATRGKMPEASINAFSSLSNLFEGSATSPGAYALALYSGLWAFDGWDQTSYVAGEMKNVNRDLPRVIHVSLAIVVLIFLSTVTSYFVILAPSLVSRTNTVALDFGSAVFGTAGGLLFAFLVAFSCFGALNGSFYTSSRLVYVAGREGYLPAIFGRLNSRTRTPLAATVLQAVLIILFVLFGSGFASLVNFYGVCSWFFYFVTVCGLLSLRIKEPNLERPYQTWLSTPILFSAVALFLLFMPIFSAPLEGAAALCFIAAGVPMYYATQTAGREAVAGIPGLRHVVSALQNCMGHRADERDPFGRRKVTRRTAQRRSRRGSASTGLDDLAEEEEEGEEEEIVEMLPRDSTRARDTGTGSSKA